MMAYKPVRVCPETQEEAYPLFISKRDPIRMGVTSRSETHSTKETKKAPKERRGRK
jgi:hypothetical protein